MKFLNACWAMVAVVPLTLAQIRQDEYGERIAVRDKGWLDHYEKYKELAHTIQYGATFYAGPNCTGSETANGSPFPDFRCDSNCIPMEPSQSMLLEGIWWNKDIVPVTPRLHAGPTLRRVPKKKWRKYYRRISIKGPTVLLYGAGGCRDSSRIGRAYIPDETSLRCINFPKPVHSVRLQHINWCRRRQKDTAPYRRPIEFVKPNEATLQDMMDAYPLVDWHRYEQLVEEGKKKDDRNLQWLEYQRRPGKDKAKDEETLEGDEDEES